MGDFFGTRTAGGAVSLEEVLRPHAADDAHPRSLLIMAPNNSMQRTALRAAADAERYAAFALGIRVSLEKGVRPRSQPRSCAS
jgi:hypothetical protein